MKCVYEQNSLVREYYDEFLKLRFWDTYYRYVKDSRKLYEFMIYLKTHSTLLNPQKEFDFKIIPTIYENIKGEFIEIFWNQFFICTSLSEDKILDFLILYDISIGLINMVNKSTIEKDKNKFKEWFIFLKENFTITGYEEVFINSVINSFGCSRTCTMIRDLFYKNEN